MSFAPLTADTLYSLEHYDTLRETFRTQVMAHKKNRTVHIGPHATWIFEDALTIQYQVQEMLRAERIFTAQGIQDELDAYTPLIPTGSNWKATFMIEFTDVVQRQHALSQFIGIERRCWVQVGDHAPVYAIADEDMERTNETKTSAVHFLRFELTPAMIAQLQSATTLSMGIDHPHYTHAVRPVAPVICSALSKDLA